MAYKGPTTFNPDDIGGSAVLSDGDLTLSRSGGSGAHARSIAGRSSGKVRVEFTILLHQTPTSDNFGVGIASLAEHSNTVDAGSSTKSFGLWPRSADTALWLGSAYVSSTLLNAIHGDTDDIIGMEIDFDNELVWFENVTDGTGLLPEGGFDLAAAGLSGAPYGIYVSITANGDFVKINSGNSPFAKEASPDFGLWL